MAFGRVAIGRLHSAAREEVGVARGEVRRLPSQYNPGTCIGFSDFRSLTLSC